MNPHIQELALKANAHELSYAYYRGEKRPENAVTLHSVDLELFAELIVRKCAEIATEQGNTAEHSFTAIRAKWFRLGAIKSATMIKRTFGVEE